MSPSRFFPNEDEAWRRLRDRGIDIDGSYLSMMVELAPSRAADLLALPPVVDVCDVCGEPVSERQTTCSSVCRTRLWRLRHASP